MATDDRKRDDLISELINLLAGPVSTGVKAVGQANQRRIEAMEHLDQVCAELRRLADVSRRMIALLDEIEGPLRAAVPQIGRLAQLVDDVLDDAPEDLGRRLSHLMTSLERLGDGLGPLLLLAQGAAGMFGGTRQPSAAPNPAPAKTSTTTAAKKTPAKTTAAKKAPAKTTAVKKAPAKKTAAKKTPAKKTPAKKTTAARRI